MYKERGPSAMAIPYKKFKEKIQLVKKYERKYKIEDLGGVLYMERRERK